MTEHDKRYLTPVDEILSDEQQREYLISEEPPTLFGFIPKDEWYLFPDECENEDELKELKESLIGYIINKGYYQPR